MRLGVDVGGTKIEAIALDDEGHELARQRRAAPQGDYNATLKAIEALILDLETETGQRGTVGIGMPGAIDARTGCIKNSNSTWLNGEPMHKGLEQLLERPVRMQNDANCFALSEAVDGAGKGFETVFGVIVGTGCGGGLVVRGAPLTGANRIAGEWGHNPLPSPTADELPGPTCYCGKTSCNETWISGPGLARDFAVRTGNTLTAEEICAKAEAKDDRALTALTAYEDRMARALSVVVNIFDPDAIVLGGGMSNVSRLYDNVPNMMIPHVMSDDPIIRLRKNVHGDSSGVRGAAWLWPLEKDSADDSRR